MSAPDSPTTGPSGGAPAGGADRLAQFRDEIATLDVRTPADGDDRRMLWAGIGLMLAGVVAIFFGYWTASGTTNLLDQVPAMISGGLFGVALVAGGSGLFVRYSMSRYLRYWLLRLVYEQRLQTDRQVVVL
jgi:hypothetical protein